MADDDSDTPISHEADEIVDNIAVADAYATINQKTRPIEIIPVLIQFGQATPWGVQNVRSNHLQNKVIWCSVVIVLVLAIVFLSFYSGVFDTKIQSIANQTKFIIEKEEEETLCACSADIFEEKFGVYKDEQVFSFLAEYEQNAEHTFNKINFKEPIDNSTCLLYDVFSYITTKLCCLKDMIINHTLIKSDNRQELTDKINGSANEYTINPP